MLQADAWQASIGLHTVDLGLTNKLCEPVPLYGHIRGKGRQPLQHCENQQNKKQGAVLQVKGRPQLNSPPHHQACMAKLAVCDRHHCICEDHKAARQLQIEKGSTAA